MRECGEQYPVVDGIHRFLPTSRLAHYEPFLRDYTAVRLAEGRGTADVDVLPAASRADARWTDRVAVDDPPAHVGDGARSGAARGWATAWWSSMSGPASAGCRTGCHELGHFPHAVDLTVDDDDGLGAARHYGPPWPRYQAEMDALPFADAQADVVVFNASLHYSTDYVRTIGEALRVLRPGGTGRDHGFTDLRSRRSGQADGRRASRRLRAALRDAIRQRRLDRVPHRRDARRHRRAARNPMGASPNVVRMAVGAATVEGAAAPTPPTEPLRRARRSVTLSNISNPRLRRDFRDPVRRNRDADVGRHVVAGTTGWARCTTTSPL